MKEKLLSRIARSSLAATVIIPACAGFFLSFAASARAAALHVLHNHSHNAVSVLTPLSHLPPGDRLNLVIGLPVRNQSELNNLFKDLYNPTSGEFHHFLTPSQFTARFGPTEADYTAVTNFAAAHGLQVVKTYDDREILDVSGSVSDIEKAFHVTLNMYRHPVENRQFYAPDTDPTVDAGLPILDVSGLDNYVLPHPMAHEMTDAEKPKHASGSASDGSYFGWDFRNAYAPGVSLNGAGQFVGLVEFEGFYPKDITNYENAASPPLPHVSVTPVYSDGLTGIPNPYSDGLAECSLDIEMPIAMAPGIAGVYVFEGTVTDHILQNMVSYAGIKQFSSSWGMSDDATANQYLVQMTIQGQTFFQASGDGDAYVVYPIYWPADNPNVVSVGGTELVMNGSGASYASESVWNSGFDSNGPWCCNGQNSSDAYWGSGGGFSDVYTIPTWQTTVNMTGVGGSASWRNLPDVAMVADDVKVYLNNGGSGDYMGTSIAAPLWAGFTALINEQGAQEGQPSVGFMSPALYAIAQGTSYNFCFNDITSGNNTWPGSTTKYDAATGYDLCTGWGSPTGAGLINALMPYSGAIWVDYTYIGATNDGTYNYPFTTLAQGVSAVSASGNIWFRNAGSKAETMTITKPMQIRAFNGAATVGN
jgi:subtilase family serine protease